MSYVFISYSHKDTDYAHKLADKLQSELIEAWIDDRIDYGSSWPHVIQEQLDNCAAFIVIMSPRAYSSEWVQNELSRAQRKGKPIFPILLEGDIWLSLEARQHVNVTGGQLPPKALYDEIANHAPRRTENEMLAEYNAKIKFFQIEIDKNFASINLDVIGDSTDIFTATMNALNARMYDGMPESEMKRIENQRDEAYARLGEALLLFAENTRLLIPEMHLNWRNFRKYIFAFFSTGETNKLVRQEDVIGFRATFQQLIGSNTEFVNGFNAPIFSPLKDFVDDRYGVLKKASIEAENAVREYVEEMRRGINYLIEVIRLVDECLLTYKDE